MKFFSTHSLSSPSTQNIITQYKCSLIIYCVLYLSHTSSIHPSMLWIFPEYLPRTRRCCGAETYIISNPCPLGAYSHTEEISSGSPLLHWNTFNFRLLLQQGKKAGDLTLPRQCPWVHEICLSHFLCLPPARATENLLQLWEKVKFTAVVANVRAYFGQNTEACRVLTLHGVWYTSCSLPFLGFWPLLQNWAFGVNIHLANSPPCTFSPILSLVSRDESWVPFSGKALSVANFLTQHPLSHALWRTVTPFWEWEGNGIWKRPRLRRGHQEDTQGFPSCCNQRLTLRFISHLLNEGERMNEGDQTPLASPPWRSFHPPGQGQSLLSAVCLSPRLGSKYAEESSLGSSQPQRLQNRARGSWGHQQGKITQFCPWLGR